ncbi:hypothetical protein AX16_007557 [Volvariella volvacea WC 439]|nr:hypothetical protein AX16_007557 [Volvariella volvacea WC 439]
MHRSSLALVALLAGGALAQSGAYQQCGGIGWTGSTTCISGYACQVINDWYWQCLPGTPTSTPGGPGTSTPTTTSPGGQETLVPGYSFIRAVEAPHFHKYLQSETLHSAGDAVLGEPATAAQFQITNGQLIQAAGSGKSLYAVVEPRANSTVMKLKMSWSETPATSGTFRFSGDTVEWSNPSISRPQNNAWLVCPDAAGNLDLYVNLGPYAYQTPAGCADETIHGYTGSTATP